MRGLLVWLSLLALAAVSAPTLRSSEVASFRKYFEPIIQKNCALSPDGRLVAIAQKIGVDSYLTIIDLEGPDEVPKHFRTGEGVDAWDLQSLVERMAWVSPKRVVFSTTNSLPVGGEIYGGYLRWIDADGSNGYHLLSTNKIQGTFQMTGGSLNPDAVLLRGRVHSLDRELEKSLPRTLRPQIGQPIDSYLELNCVTGERRFLEKEEFKRLSGPTPERVQILEDRKNEIQTLFPSENFSIKGLSADGKWALLLGQEMVDPGFLAVYDAQRKSFRVLFRFSRQAGEAEGSKVKHLFFEDERGIRHEALLAIPLRPRTPKPPMVVFVGNAINNSYDPRAHALLDLGFAVLKVKGNQGEGIDKLRITPDTLPKLSGHQHATILYACDSFAINRRRLFLWGDGQLATVTIDLGLRYPELYRVFVFVNPRSPKDAQKEGGSELDDWATLFPKGKGRKVAEEARIHQVDLVLGGANYASRTKALEDLGFSIRRVKVDPKNEDLRPGMMDAKLFAKTAAFLIEEMRQTEVKVGPATPIESDRP